MAAPSASGNELARIARAAPYLERDEEHNLAVRWKDSQDTAALNALTAAHMRLVISIAAKFRHFGLSMNDLIQEGTVGLLEAASRFDPDREVRFSTYATWWIRASIQDHILRNWSIVRGGTSSAQKALFFNLKRLRVKMRQSRAQLSNVEVYREIATALGVSPANVALMDSRLSGPDTSLNAPLADDGGNQSERQDFLVCDRPLQDTVVGETIDSERRRKWLRDAMKTLNPREMHIVEKRQLSETTATLEALGLKLGISKERVRQIESRALQKLRVALHEASPEMSARF